MSTPPTALVLSLRPNSSPSPCPPFQDTIVALQALSWYASLSGSAAIELSVEVVRESSSHVEARFHIDSTNYLLRQSQEVTFP